MGKSRTLIQKFGSQIENLQQLNAKEKAGTISLDGREQITAQTRAAKIRLFNMKEDVRMRKLVIDDKVRRHLENEVLGIPGYRHGEYE